MTRSLFIAHGHPLFSRGGGEVAAYRAFQAHGGPNGDGATFLAWAPPEQLGDRPLHRLSPHELLFGGSSQIDTFCQLRSDDDNAVICSLVQALRPEVLHIHHFWRFGIDTLLCLRALLPGARFVLTLHEFLAICRANGQMASPAQHGLCELATPERCSQCFPELPLELLLRRRQLATMLLEAMDLVLSPSRFLIQRFAACGFDTRHFHHLENITEPPLATGLGRPIAPPAAPATVRFTYMGQLIPEKGVERIARAFLLARERLAQLHGGRHAPVRLSIHGGASRPDLHGDWLDTLERLVAAGAGSIRLEGPYRPEEAWTIAAASDWLVMGSGWWENSPLVIQEALAAGTPVIAPLVGGMREKIEAGAGLGYPLNGVEGLAEVMVAAVTGGADREAICCGLPPVMRGATYVARLRELLSSPSPRSRTPVPVAAAAAVLTASP